MKIKTGFSLIVMAGLFLSCHFNYVDKNQFEGKWRLSGRPDFSGMEIQIRKTDRGYAGHVKSPPHNQTLAGFLPKGSIWVSSIQRNSNFQFTLTENRPAGMLLKQYDLPTQTSWHAEFIHKDTVGLSLQGDPQNSKIRYIRIKD